MLHGVTGFCTKCWRNVTSKLNAFNLLDQFEHCLEKIKKGFTLIKRHIKVWKTQEKRPSLSETNTATVLSM